MIVIIIAIVGAWVGAVFLRRRYIKKKEAIEMSPVAWGPHQMQGATGGYNYGDAAAGSKEAKTMRGDVPEKKGKGWLTKLRS